MSEETEQMAQSLFINHVPEAWSKVFLSLKPLSSWIIDLNQRIKFFQGQTAFGFFYLSLGESHNTGMID